MKRRGFLSLLGAAAAAPAMVAKAAESRGLHNVITGDPHPGPTWRPIVVEANGNTVTMTWYGDAHEAFYAEGDEFTAEAFGHTVSVRREGTDDEEIAQSLEDAINAEFWGPA